MALYALQTCRKDQDERTPTARHRRGVESLDESSIDETEAAEALASFDAVWQALTFQEQGKLLRLLIQRINYDGGRQKIALVFHPTGIGFGRSMPPTQRGVGQLMHAVTIECDFHVGRAAKGRQTFVAGPEPAMPKGRLPKVTRWMALAIKLDGLVRSGAIRSYSEVADLGHVTRARISQIMNLLNLAPDIQEAILFLPPVERGRDPGILAELQPIAGEVDWEKQRKMWRRWREGEPV
ncbi:MAG: hypothetical protein U0744_03290 [Gemmataceae bacterium]